LLRNAAVTVTRRASARWHKKKEKKKKKKIYYKKNKTKTKTSVRHTEIPQDRAQEADATQHTGGGPPTALDPAARKMFPAQPT
jgi:hypothetical protein